MKRRNFRPTVLYYLIGGLLLVGVGWYAHALYDHTHGNFRHSRLVKAQGFRFTSPLLDVELPEGIIISQEPIPFKHKVEKLVRTLIESGEIREAAVYFRDLHDGPWFGINEETQFNPASMMKVPVMIAWLKRAEKDPGVLSKKLSYNGKEDSIPPQDLTPDHTLAAGSTYTVEELLHYMLSYSDNRATTVLFRVLDEKELNAVFDGMDVNNKPNDEGNSISVHGYSGFSIMRLT